MITKFFIFPIKMFDKFFEFISPNNIIINNGSKYFLKNDNLMGSLILK